EPPGSSGPNAARPAERPSTVYRAVRALARVLVALFYRRVEVTGLAHVPARGPGLLAANHPNALADPPLLIAPVPRPLPPLAKRPLFSLPVLGSILHALGAIPVRRRQDVGAAGVENTAMFEAAGRALRSGGSLLIFPEGLSQPEPTLMPLRTGAARIA